MNTANEVFTFEFLGMNTLELAAYIGIILIVMLIALILVKRR